MLLTSHVKAFQQGPHLEEFFKLFKLKNYPSKDFLSHLLQSRSNQKKNDLRENRARLEDEYAVAVAGTAAGAVGIVFSRSSLLFGVQAHASDQPAVGALPGGSDRSELGSPLSRGLRLAPPWGGGLRGEAGIAEGTDEQERRSDVGCSMASASFAPVAPIAYVSSRCVRV